MRRTVALRRALDCLFATHPSSDGVIQMGHDYRPDYKKLSMLKTLFPGGACESCLRRSILTLLHVDVQIVALTATCPPHVLQDL